MFHAKAFLAHNSHIMCRTLLNQSLQAQDRLKMKPTHLEARLRHNNIRIYGISEGAEENDIQQFIDNIIKKELQPLAEVELGIQWCHIKERLALNPWKRQSPGR